MRLFAEQDNLPRLSHSVIVFFPQSFEIFFGLVFAILFVGPEQCLRPSGFHENVRKDYILRAFRLFAISSITRSPLLEGPVGVRAFFPPVYPLFNFSTTRRLNTSFLVTVHGWPPLREFVVLGVVWPVLTLFYSLMNTCHGDWTKVPFVKTPVSCLEKSSFFWSVLLFTFYLIVRRPSSSSF